MNTSSLETADDARHLLGRFLRARREAMPVSAAGISALSARRRTPGLRREEVAQLAAISTAWYTWLEQGREMSLSASALARLAEVLRLSAAERGYLFELARRRDPAPPAAVDDNAAVPALRAAVQAMPMPAYLLDRTWRLRAWNASAAELFAPWLASGESCLLRYVFFDPSARSFIRDWDERAGRLVAEFRADSALYPNDAALACLIAELQRDSTAFADFWSRHSVLAREGGQRAFNHPKQGFVLRNQITLVPSCSPDHKLVLLLPAGDGFSAEHQQP
jgi:transcriptional regulator with XRE-family HTH domain